jgi:hypothetical protein
MRQKLLVIGAALSATLLGWRGDVFAQTALPTPAAQPATGVTAGAQRALPEPEVLEQGPIHEAFAEPMALEKQERETTTKQPPEPVNELPPQEQPEGQNVQWIPGYWMWDQGRNDYVWVSGMWRDAPPGRNWVPGEWQQVGGGFQWAPGFWADAKQEQVQLLPEPPASLEQGPSSPSPGENYLWAPGNWYWQNGDYVWQPGYWYEANPNWVWVPNHYSYSPTGYAYVSGYWDYQPYDRGWLYAPVYWGSGYGGGYGYGYYRPSSVINTALLIANLAVNRGYGHYYYGNWGGGYPGWLQPWGYNYGQWGYRGGNYFGYDPLWSHFRWSNRNHWDNDWWRDRNNWYGNNRNRNDWDRWSWNGRGRGDWDRGGRDGRPGDRDRDRDGRPGDWAGRRPGDRDGRPGDWDGRGGRDRNRDLVTTIDNLNRSGVNVRSRDLSQADLDRIRNRSQEFRSRRDNIIADANRTGRGGVNAQGRDRQGPGRTGVDGQLGADNRGQGNRGQGNRGQGNLGQGNRGRTSGQLGADGRISAGENLDARSRLGAEGQGRRDTGYRGPRGDLNAQGQGNVRDNLDSRNRGSQQSQVQRSIDQLRGRTNQSGPNLDGRTYSRGQQGPQFGDRPRGQTQQQPGNVQRNLEGPVQQRVMRLPSGQQVMPQGQNFRSQGRPQGSLNQGSRPRPSINIPQGGGAQRSLQQAPRSIQRSSPNLGGGGRPSFQGNRGGGGRSGGPAIQGGGGGRGGGPARGGGGGGGRGRGGDRD